MEQIKNLLKERETQLLQLKEETERSLMSAPEGSLRICSHGGRTQYYHRTDPKDFNGTYIREADLDIARKLAQKDYDKKIIHTAEKELSAIRKYLVSCPDISAEQLYQQFRPTRQCLIKPVIEPDNQYVRKWESVSYEGKGFFADAPEFYTAKGERVRSKSEVIIADLLNRESVPYRYEYPLLLKGLGNVYPDFTILHINKRTELYWEHLGMMDDTPYAEKALQKNSTYEQNGFYLGEKLIITYETKKSPLSQKMILRKIRRYLK